MTPIHNFEETQQAELKSWFSDDPVIARDKRIREMIRYPLLKKQMGLEYLDTSDMLVWDIGSGPFGGVSSVLNAKHIERFDPLGDEYAKYYPQQAMYAKKAEDLDLSQPDLIIITNALDHFDNPHIFLTNLVRNMKPGAFFAHLHAIDNAYSHPHKAHAHNFNPEMLKTYLSEHYECVWYQDFMKDGLTYGWRKQPAFSGLYRKTTGYAT